MYVKYNDGNGERVYKVVRNNFDNRQTMSFINRDIRIFNKDLPKFETKTINGFL